MTWPTAFSMSVAWGLLSCVVQPFPNVEWAGLLSLVQIYPLGCNKTGMTEKLDQLSKARMISSDSVSLSFFLGCLPHSWPSREAMFLWYIQGGFQGKDPRVPLKMVTLRWKACPGERKISPEAVDYPLHYRLPLLLLIIERIVGFFQVIS